MQGARPVKKVFTRQQVNKLADDATNLYLGHVFLGTIEEGLAE